MSEEQHQKLNLPRRTVVAGAAWSIPTILVATTAPLAAASPCRTTVTFQATAPAAAGIDSFTTPFTVPAGVTKVNFTVVGAPGGGDVPNRLTGGLGGIVTGELSVAPGTILQLQVGQGGTGGPGPSPYVASTTGGRGFGNGGDSIPVVAGERAHAGSSGGGGSAILVGTNPLVVAGGGGGSPTYNISPIIALTGPPQSYGQGGSPGDPADDLLVQTTLAANGHTDQLSGPAGGNASGSTPGAGGIATSVPTEGPITYFGTNNGLPGSGRNGGNGVSVAGALPSTSWRKSSPGGGGGYAGGGSGSAQRAEWGIAPGNHASTRLIIDTAGAGGAGSNFVSSVPVGTSAVTSSLEEIPTGVGPAGPVRVPGSITLTYCA
ncbi:hypothetical protein C5B85_12945 [Pseudoclavibacter sp. AY1F1]|nr:hypothetical protein C5B85_12945 [Pseudoclavibacter sp. AY1F1]